MRREAQAPPWRSNRTGEGAILRTMDAALWPIEPELVDPEALGRWMDDQGLQTGEPFGSGELLVGGTQNVLLKFSRGDASYVLRRPPQHKRKNSDATMAREARVLKALADSDVPHPAFIAGTDDLSVLGAAFYLMEPLDGFVAAQGLPDLHKGDPEIRRRMGLSMADAIAGLARVDHEAKGLVDLGKPGYLERQVPRWRAHMAAYDEVEEYEGHGIDSVDEVADWLEAHRPENYVNGIIHGDFHLLNVMFRRDSGELDGVIDWELSTIGDPLVDLGQLVALWPGEDPTADLRIEPWDGFPTATELVDRYADGSERDLSNINWYTVLACFRLGIILEGTNVRAAAGKAPKEFGDALHATTVKLFTKAASLLT